MWDLDHKEVWMLKNWCFWTVMSEKTLESTMGYKEIKPVNPKGNQSWIFIRRTDSEAGASVLGHLMREADTRKDHDAGEDWKQEENRTTEDKIVGWHHWHNEHEFEWALGNREGQRTLSCCSPWGRKCQTCLSNWRTTARFVMAFLPRSKHLIILWLQSPFTVIWRPKN